MTTYYGIATDPFAVPDQQLGAPLADASNVNLSAQGALTPRAAALVTTLAAPAAPEFWNFGRQWWVDGEYVYASRLMQEDVPDELLYLYIGPAPRILWCADGGTYVSVTGKLIFLAGGNWPPEPKDVLDDTILSTNAATGYGLPHAYILAQHGVWKLDQSGSAERVDNQQYTVPADLGPVVGTVIVDETGLERVVFSEAALY